MNRRGFLGALLATPAVPYVPAPVSNIIVNDKPAPKLSALINGAHHSYGRSIVEDIQEYRWNHDVMAEYWRDILARGVGGYGGKL